MPYPNDYILSLVNPLIKNLGATLGTVNLQFNKNTNYTSTLMTGDLTLTLVSSGNIEGVQLVVPIDGNLINNLILPSIADGWYDIKGVLFNNNKRNIYTFYFIGGSVLYSNNRIPLPVVPGIPVYNLQNITAIGSIGATFNVQLNKTATVKWMLSTSSTQPTKTQLLAGTGAVGSDFGSTLVTLNITSLIPLTSLVGLTSYYLYSYAIDSTGNESAIQTAINFSTTASQIIAQDTFTGADTSSILASLRVTPVGGFAWNGAGTSTLGIVSNVLKLINGTTGNFAYAYFNPGKRDIDVSIIVSNAGVGQNSVLWMAFQDGANLLQIGEGCGVYQNVGNVGTTLIAGNSSGNWQNGDTIRVILNGVNISVYRNGVLFGTSTSVSTSLTGQNVGYYINGDIASSISSITVY